MRSLQTLSIAAELPADRPKPSGEICLGGVDEIPPGEGRVFALGGERVAVFRSRNGKFYAVQSDCPHQGGPLADGVVGGCAVVCPLHSWKFDLETGQCLSGGEARLRTYSLRVSADRLFLAPA